VIIYTQKTAGKGKGISSKTNNELITMALTEEQSNLEAIVQEAWKRQNSGLMYMMACSDKIIANPSFFNIITKYVRETKDEGNKLDVLNALLSHQPAAYGDSSSKLNEIIHVAMVSPQLAALTLISSGTPLPVVAKIVDAYKLNDPRIALFTDASFVGSNVSRQNKVLEHIQQLLSNGYSFENIYSAGILLKRLNVNAGDRFVAEIAKYDMHPEIADEFDKMSKQWGKFNPKLLTNFSNNKFDGVKNFKFSNSILVIEKNPDEVIPQILEFLFNETKESAIKHCFDILRYKCLQYPDVFNKCLIEEFKGRNVFVEFASQNASMCKDCLTFVFDKIQKQGFGNIHVFREVVVKIATMAIYNFGLKDLIHQIPPEILQYVPLKQEDRDATSKKEEESKMPNKPQIEMPKGFAYTKIRASTQKDWYKYAKLVSDI